MIIWDEGIYTRQYQALRNGEWITLLSTGYTSYLGETGYWVNKNFHVNSNLVSEVEFANAPSAILGINQVRELRGDTKNDVHALFVELDRGIAGVLPALMISVTINGQQVTFAGQPPVIIDGRTLVPVRGVFEALGFNVEWEPNEQRTTLSREGETVAITVGSATFTVNGEDHALDVPAQIIGGRTMLPFRVVVESVGYSVDWDVATQTVIITR